MIVNGPIELAGFEELSSDPVTLLFNGRAYYNTSSNEIRYYNGSAWVTVASLTNTQTMTNKTFTSAIANTSFTYDNQAESRYREQTGNGTNYEGFSAPDAVTANTIWKLPDGDGASSQVLSTDGAKNLQWSNAATIEETIDAAAGASGITIGDTDENIHIFTPSSDIIVKLDNTYSIGRKVKIFNDGSSDAVITVDANDNSDIIMIGVGGYAELLTIAGSPADSGDWKMVDAKADSLIRMSAGNGHGSTNTAIRRFTNIAETKGGDITFSDGVAAGTSFTINQAGRYSVHYTDRRSASSCFIGVSLDASVLNTSILSITKEERLAVAESTSNLRIHCSVTFDATVGQVVRAHTDGTPALTTDNSVIFVIAQVAKF